MRPCDFGMAEDAVPLDVPDCSVPLPIQFDTLFLVFHVSIESVRRDMEAGDQGIQDKQDFADRSVIRLLGCLTEIIAPVGVNNKSLVPRSSNTVEPDKFAVGDRLCSGVTLVLHQVLVLPEDLLDGGQGLLPTRLVLICPLVCSVVMCVSDDPPLFPYVVLLDLDKSSSQYWWNYHVPVLPSLVL